MNRAILAGLFYFGIVFVFGFLFGVVREIYVVDHLGPVLSRLAEAPPILGVSWVVAGWLIRRFQVPADATARLAMGGLALSLLLVCEAILGVYGFGQTLKGHMGEYATLKGVTGLAAQAMFGLVPWMMAQRHSELDVTE
jgi:hypothetical protein